MGFFSQKVPKEDLVIDEREKRGIIEFWDILFHRFFKFCNINLVYILFAFPFMAVSFFLSPINANVVGGLIPSLAEGVTVSGTSPLLFDITLRMMFVCVFSILFGFGPATCSLAYVSRQYSRREHVWIWSDMKDAYKVNFLKGLIVYVIDMAFVWAALNAIFYYRASYAASNNGFMPVMIGLVSLFIIIYIIMHGFIYQFIVTYEDKLFRIYKNSWLMMLAKFIPVLLINLLAFVLILIPFYVFGIWGLVLMVFNMLSICYFMKGYYCAKAIRSMSAK